ncbi:hypothetical protein CCHL11_10294 [Colletotrichum chlorophyti]|uniref:Uncharacterized protein n=1 Tax=Colletotrichum chlorophyti TaxID=708187 RepID=A0A1Q8S1B2_9PEZI|nr:hypothetical protein CCHL11_10294 [Colletotrichum chlorophyti]
MDYSKHEVFASLQAELIYIIMRIVDGCGSTDEERDYNRTMILAYKTLWNQFMKLINATCGGMSDSPTSWEDWILAESITRVGCVWFLVAQVACVQIGISCSILDVWKDLQLPCHKAQWAASARLTWDEETRALRNMSKRGSDITCLGELVECSRGADEPSNADRLDAWNAGTDSLGVLLSLCTTMM